MFNRKTADILYAMGKIPERYYVQLYLSPEEAETFFWKNTYNQGQIKEQLTPQLESVINSALDEAIKRINGK